MTGCRGWQQMGGKMDNNNFNQYDSGGSYDSTNSGGYSNPNPYYGSSPDPDELPMTVGEWLLTIILSAIPCIGFVMLLIWGFGGSGNINRRNYARAMLIVEAVIFVLYLLLFLLGFVPAFATLGRMG